MVGKRGARLNSHSCVFILGLCGVRMSARGQASKWPERSSLELETDCRTPQSRASSASSSHASLSLTPCDSIKVGQRSSSLSSPPPSLSLPPILLFTPGAACSWMHSLRHVRGSKRLSLAAVSVGLSRGDLDIGKCGWVVQMCVQGVLYPCPCVGRQKSQLSWLCHRVPHRSRSTRFLVVHSYSRSTQ